MSTCTGTCLGNTCTCSGQYMSMHRRIDEHIYLTPSCSTKQITVQCVRYSRHICLCATHGTFVFEPHTLTMFAGPLWMAWPNCCAKRRQLRPRSSPSSFLIATSKSLITPSTSSLLHIDTHNTKPNVSTLSLYSLMSRLFILSPLKCHFQTTSRVKRRFQIVTHPLLLCL